jgi:two-component system nitrogen regulation response regulator NtrX
LVLREIAGIRTVGAATSEEALKLAQRRRFDAVLSDINRWPGLNGLDFLKVFKHAHPTVPVIIVSGSVDEATARRARWLRAHDCMAKPFDCRKLAELVRAAIRSRKMCRSLVRSRRRARFGGASQ